MRALYRMPLILLLTGIASASMIVPAAVALAEEEFHDARSFFYAGIVGMVLTALIAIAQKRAPNLLSFMSLRLHVLGATAQ